MTENSQAVKPEPWDYDDDDDVECWKCQGLGILADCFEDTCCGLDCDPEEPEFCCAPVRCDICRGKGRYPLGEATDG